MNGNKLLEDHLEALDKSIQTFCDAASEYPADLIRLKPTEKAFSATEIVYHMLEVERLWQRRIHGLLDHTSTYFQQMNPDKEAKENKYNEKPYREGIEELKVARQETSKLVRSMKPRELELTGTHSKYGPMNTYKMLSTMSEHDHTHLAQLKRTLLQVQTGSVINSK